MEMPTLQLLQPETIRNLVMRSVTIALSSEHVGHLVAAHGDTCEVGHFGECREEGSLTDSVILCWYQNVS